VRVDLEMSADMSAGSDAPDLPADWLHARVCELRRRTRRRLFDPVLDVVGASPVRPLAGSCLPAGEPLDHALRVQLLLGLYDESRGTSGAVLHLVVTRPGPAALESGDLGWRFAWTTACAVADDRAGTTTIVTRYGFVDTGTGSVVRTPLRRHLR
jgi:hypothetical protein